MDMRGTSDAMGLFDDAGATFGSDWSGALQTIQDSAGQLGGGPLGEAFMSKYKGPAITTAQRATEAAYVPERLAAAGLECVRDYYQADEASSQAMPTGPAPGPRPR
jgi:hypothetical protein